MTLKNVNGILYRKAEILDYNMVIYHMSLIGGMMDMS